jgi:hypothetical protein
MGEATTAGTDGLAAFRPSSQQMPVQGHPTPVISQATESMNGVTLPQSTIDHDKLRLPPRHCERNLTRFQQPSDRPAELEVMCDLHPNGGGLLRVAALGIIVNQNL